jgi:hypothetical protein
VEQRVVHRLAPHPRAFDEDAQVGARLGLAHEIGELLGPQGAVGIPGLGAGAKVGSGLAMREQSRNARALVQRHSSASAMPLVRPPPPQQTRTSARVTRLGGLFGDFQPAGALTGDHHRVVKGFHQRQPAFGRQTRTDGIAILARARSYSTTSAPSARVLAIFSAGHRRA